MASIRINCPACGKTLEVEADAAGKEVECGECFEIFIAKAPESTIRGEPSGGGKIPAARPGSKPARKPASKPARRRDDDDDDDDEDYDPRPSRRRNSGGGETNGTAVAALVLGILAVITSCCPVTGILFGILALVLGLIGKNQSGGSGIAIAAIILGLIALVFSGGILIWTLGMGGFNRWGN